LFMNAEPKPKKEETETDEETKQFIAHLDAGDYDGHLFEEIRKLRAEHLARICRQLSNRKFGSS